MTDFLLDTNIVPERIRPPGKRNESVVQWLSTQSSEVWLSVITATELVYGIRALIRREAARAAQLDEWFSTLRPDFADRVLAVDEAVARQAGEWRATHNVGVEDALIAATAARHGLICVTPNERDFRATGVRLYNPFIS